MIPLLREITWLPFFRRFFGTLSNFGDWFTMNWGKP
jgi:hypothetical protein